MESLHERAKNGHSWNALAIKWRKKYPGKKTRPRLMRFHLTEEKKSCDCCWNFRVKSLEKILYICCVWYTVEPTRSRSRSRWKSSQKKKRKFPCVPVCRCRLNGSPWLRRSRAFPRIFIYAVQSPCTQQSSRYARVNPFLSLSSCATHPHPQTHTYTAEYDIITHNSFHKHRSAFPSSSPARLNSRAPTPLYTSG